MTKEYQILEEAQVKKLLTVALANEAIETCFREKAAGTFMAHPKVNIQGKHGRLTITPGESQAISKIIGFRLYDTIRNDYSNQPQLIVVYNNETGRMKGIVISQLVGAYRTASINAVMQKHLRKTKVHTLGLVGTGFQAGIHLETFYKTLHPQTVFLYGRTAKNTTAFLAKMEAKLNIKIQVSNTIGELAQVADSLLFTTRSQTPLLQANQLKKGVTITTIGPKTKGASELPESLANACDLVATDSIEQVQKYGDQFFIQNQNNIIDFADIIGGKHPGRTSDDQKILLCSVGMGGTEIALADRLLQLAAKK